MTFIGRVFPISRFDTCLSQRTGIWNERSQRDRSIRPGENKWSAKSTGVQIWTRSMTWSLAVQCFLQMLGKDLFPVDELTICSSQGACFPLIFQGWRQKSTRWTKARSSITPIYIFYFSGGFLRQSMPNQIVCLADSLTVFQSIPCYTTAQTNGIT